MAMLSIQCIPIIVQTKPTADIAKQYQYFRKNVEKGMVIYNTPTVLDGEISVGSHGKWRSAQE